VPGFTEIENYQPEDTAWGVVIGPFMRPPAESEQQEQDAALDPDDEDES
jgi:hypothetical protein